MTDYNNHATSTQRELSKKLNGEPKQSNLILDKLAFTAKLPPEKYISFVRAADQLVDEKQLRISKATYHKGNRYCHSFSILYMNRDIGQLLCWPTQPNISFLRMGCSPAKIGRSACLHIQRLLRALIGDDFEQVMRNAVITTLHPAIDVENNAIDDLYIVDPFKRESGKWASAFDDSGAFETVNIGSPKARVQITIYNKTQELMETGYDADAPRVRFEGKQKVRVRARELASVQNPFRHLIVSKISNDAFADLPLEVQFFLDSCRYRTPQAALKMITNKRLRTKFANYLREQSPDWWNPDAVWGQLMNTVRDCGLFPYAAFMSDEELPENWRSHGGLYWGEIRPLPECVGSD